MTANPESNATICVDLGGTKILTALISDGEILDRDEKPTRSDETPDEWIADLSSVAEQWNGRYCDAAMAVTGQVTGGHWTAVNKATLDLSGNYPLEARLSEAMGCPTYAINDAQAAAWGEYRNGTSAQADMVFLTISTGLGGGIVINGDLVHGRNGLAGHFGQLASDDERRPGPLEDHMSGRWIAAEAARREKDGDAASVFAAAAEQNGWAESIVSESARRAALLCQNIQMTFDPEFIVIGGGVGLANGYLDRMTNYCAKMSAFHRPNLVPAALGKDAGIIGLADLTIKNRRPPTGRK